MIEEENTTADALAPTGDAEKDRRAKKRCVTLFPERVVPDFMIVLGRLEEEIARMKKNQERRLHRKNAKIVKEGGTPMQLNRPVKPDTTVRSPPILSAYLLTREFTETLRTLRTNGPHEYVQTCFKPA